MQVHDLRAPAHHKDAKRVGRGGKRGKTSGKGMKGQKARQGNSTRPEMRDIIKKIPKLRGQGKNGNRSRDIIRSATAINVAMLEQYFNVNEIVSVKTLLQKGLASKSGGKLPYVKILGNGELTKPLRVVGLEVSASAQEKISKQGGTVS